MNTENLPESFINDPNTVDFIARSTATLEKYAKDNPNVILVQTLLDRFVIGYTNRNFLGSFSQALGINFKSVSPFVLGLLDRDNLDLSGILRVQERPYLNLRGSGTLVAIIDTGIDYSKSSFIYENGNSKIQYIYDQSAIGQPPEGFLFGVEYTNAQINEALKSNNPYDIVPEQDTVGHGTFLASVAAGVDENDNIGAAPEADLIVVKLRKARPYYREMYLVPPEQDNAYESTAVMVGIDYVLKKAEELRKPVAICLGIGTNQGGHDGFSLFEEYLSEIANTPGVCLCTAAGNESQAQHHMQGFLKKNEDIQTIDINVGKDAGDIYLSIWNIAADRLSVSVRSPTGEAIGRVPAKPDTVLKSKLVLEKSSVIVEYYFPFEGSGGQLTVVKILNATPGIWSILVFGDIVLDGVFHAWLPITGFISEQVKLLSSNPYYTVVVPATSLGPITCGAYDTKTNKLYADTSWGPTRLPSLSPDLVAPGVDVGGINLNGPGTMSGTSVSAAITTGAAALMLQWGIVEKNDPAMGTYQIKAYMIRGCSRDETITYPNTKWGYGKLNLIQSFNLMREF